MLATDACPYRRHIERNGVYPLVPDVGGLLEGYRKLRRLASHPDLIVPGHAPWAMTAFPKALADDGLIVRLA